jgi:hypothetical protein
MLVKRKSEREECWAWARRLFLNRAFIFASELFEAAFKEDRAVHTPYRKHARSRLSHRHGLWFEPESLPGPRVYEDVNGTETFTAYLLSSKDVEVRMGVLSEITRLNADAYFMVASSGLLIVSPIYAFVGCSSPLACASALEDLANVYDRISSDAELPSQICLSKPILIWADFLDDRGVEDVTDVRVIHVGIPVINDDWFSPPAIVVEQVREALIP